MRSTSALAALLLSSLLAGCGDDPAASASKAESTDRPWSATPAEGTRRVGMNGVVVAVPDWWTTGETRCLAPVETTVYFDEAATADCPDPVPDAVVQEVSALAVLDARSGYGEKLIGEMEPIGEVDGLEVLERQGCERWFEGVCRQVFAVPEVGVIFAVTIHDEADGDYEEIRDSLRVVPDGTTTVPLASADGWTPSWGDEPATVDAVVEAVEEAGLEAAVVTAERPEGANVDLADLPRGSLLGVEPALGSAIEDGGTVTITVSGPRPER